MAEQRLIRIISDGTRHGSDVIDLRSGETLRYVEHVRIDLDGMLEPKAKIEVLRPDLDITILATVDQVPWVTGLEQQLAEARAIIEQVANWNIELSDTVGHARAWLEKYPDAAGGEHGERA